VGLFPRQGRKNLATKSGNWCRGWKPSCAGSRTFRGENVIINTGTRATIDPTPGLHEAGPLTHIEALELDHVPKHLLILGGGYVGLELAQAMRRFDSGVTIIERNKRLAHREDPDISEACMSEMKGSTS
jgi:pyruvate/2-oxoglutarate dehydrogenase complex dihydrolipoamide dehydrogenase (E3) component